MTNESPVDASAIAENEAAVWLDRLERTLKDGESAELRSWLKVRMNREAIVSQCRLWHGPEILAVLSELVSVETMRRKVDRWYGRMVLAIFLGVSGISLCTVIVAVSKVLPHKDAHGNLLRAEGVFETPLGGRRRIELPDGGAITLNTATRVLLIYSPRSRSFTLLRGEATFEVIENAARPFELHAGARRFVATSAVARFNVRRLSDENVELTVLAGEVRAASSRFSATLTPAQLRARVEHGEHTFGESEGGIVGAGWYSAATLAPQESLRRLAWQKGRLIFANAPLEDVLAEFERYVAVQFAFAEERLRDIRVDADLATGDVDGLLRHLRVNYAIDSQLDANGRHVLTPIVVPTQVGTSFGTVPIEIPAYAHCCPG